MKRIVNGVAYNTETSVALAKWSEPASDHDPKNHEHTLYQTRKGAFFLHLHEDWGMRVDGEWVERTWDNFAPMTSEEAHKWLMGGDVEVLAAGESVFPDLPEAEAESTAGATIYLRLPEALKRQIEKMAKARGISVNQWAIVQLNEAANRPLAPQQFEGIVSDRKKADSAD